MEDYCEYTREIIERFNLTESITVKDYLDYPREARAKLPKNSGVYFVILPYNDDDIFIDPGTGGHYKGKDPNIRINELLKRFGKNAYPVDQTSIEKYVCQKLLEKNITIATAESCTGGLIASKLVDYPGISKVFKEGFVTYSNEAKIKRLNVKEETLEKYGAVSIQTAKEMAKGAALAAETDIGLAVTGIAGPEGGTHEKPVGLVYIAIYYKGKTHVRESNYPGGRNIIRERSANYSFDFLKREILS